MEGSLLLVHSILGPVEVPIHDHGVPVAIADDILCLLEPLFQVEPGIKQSKFINKGHVRHDIINQK